VTRGRVALEILAALLLWEMLGRFDLVAGGALPGPSEILVRFVADIADYPRHVGATLSAAAAGYVIGNALAILAGVLYALSPTAATLARGVNITLFALPPIAIVPVLVVTLDGDTARVLLAALGCWYTTMAATLLGLTRVDPRTVDVVRAWGGTDGDVFRLVRLRGAIPSVLAGLQVAAPNAVLGAILAEFGSGSRWGLGSYLLGSMGRADPARLWGIGLTATAIAGLAYLAVALLSRRFTAQTRSLTLSAQASQAVAGPTPAWMLVVAGLLPFALWWALVTGFALPEMIAKSPAAVATYLFTEPTGAAARARLLPALLETLPITLLGMAAGLAVAFALAVLSRSFGAVRRTLLPVALVTQSMPLVALTPLLVLLVGRGSALILVVTVSVTFFPAFVTIAQGLAMVPRTALDLSRAWGGSWWTEVRLVAAPAAMPHLFAAAGLAAPRALLGVMIAEWLATGTGLGNLLNQSRGYLDYAMIWAVAAISVMVSVALTLAVLRLERNTLSRMGF
jgi:ABC-type nitrate/sulfonate/bicarbonate transport system permease component